MAETGRRGTARGFTIMEMMLVLLVIFVLMGLLLGGIRHMSKFARVTADRASVASLKQAVTKFEQEMGFPPPFVWDMPVAAAGVVQGPLPATAPYKPVVFDAGQPQQVSFLRTQPPAAAPDLRFSVYSLSYYVVGVLDQPRDGTANGPAIDGLAGPGFRTVRPDGSFNVAGRVFQPFFDVSRNANAVYATDAAQGRIELRDRNGIAFRYYRWEAGDPSSNPPGAILTPANLNVPMFLGDPSTNEQLKKARWAIVGAGPNGLFGNEEQLPSGHPQYLTSIEVRARLGLPGSASFQQVWEKASADNVMEIGQ